MAQIQCNFFSYSLGYPVDISVVLPSFTPKDMENDVHTHKLPAKFPVMYLLHGYGGDHRAWLRYTSAERYVEEHRIALVTISCHNKAYLNAPLGENFYDFLDKEVQEFVESYFPVSADPKERYIAGLSMGGYGAMLHGLKNPERYNAIGAFSPGIPDPKGKQDINKVMREDLYKITRQALASGKQLPDLFMCIGDQDFLYERVTDYHKTFEKKWKNNRYRYDDLPDYEHEFAIWDLALSEFLDWIERGDVYKRMGKNKV